MTGRAGGQHPALNLVASDLFFGLGAVMLVVVAALSLGLQQMVTRLVADRVTDAEDTSSALAALSRTDDVTLLLADAEGLHHIQGGTETSVALDEIWAFPQLSDWLADEPLLVIAPSGQETAFLTFARAAEIHPEPLATLRLTQDCRTFRRSGTGFACQP